MNIIIDNRENYLINELNNMETKSNMQIEQLNLGDIIIRDENNKDLLVFERKTYSDLLSSIKDSRLHEQSYRLSNTLEINTHSIIYLLEGDILFSCIFIIFFKPINCFFYTLFKRCIFKIRQ